MTLQIAVAKKLRTEQGVKDFNYKIDVPAGECVGIEGLSGAGKSSLLKMIAGLTLPDNGKIIAGEQIWFDKENHVNLIPQKRRCGYLHQHPVIFPFLTVEKNILFAAKEYSKARLYLKILGLKEFSNYRPHYLSGGQIKRAALAQLFAYEPDYLLLDEPFASLDDKWIELIIDLLSHFQYEKKRTLLIVSHQHNILRSLSDRIIRIVPGGTGSIGFPNHFSCRKSPYPSFYFSKSSGG